MLQNIKNRKFKNESGFTIIEVLIVLAIAGLILLVVFLAVPALQRNARNTTTKQDVSNVLGGFAEYQAANGGKMPTGVAGTGTVNYTGAAGSTATTANVQGTTVVSLITTAPAAASPPAAGTVQVLVGRKCNGTVSSRAVSAYFSIETASSTTNQQCQDS